jgi:glyoxalase family protein
LACAGGGPGTIIDVLNEPDLPWGSFGLGAIHHIAFAVDSLEDEHLVWRSLSGAGMILTDLRDRKWFHSTYLTEPGGINIEFSNLDPGFTVDEPLEELGTTLQLPKQWEADRQRIESELPAMNW